MIFTFFRTFERHNSNSNVVTYVMLYINRFHFSRPFRICVLCICLDLPICFKNRSNVHNTWFFRIFKTFERHNSNFCDVTYVMLYIVGKHFARAFQQYPICIPLHLPCGLQRPVFVKNFSPKIIKFNFRTPYLENSNSWGQNFLIFENFSSSSKIGMSKLAS